MKFLECKLVFEYKTPLGGISVDGYNPETNTIYEFLGCYFHGCKNCFNWRQAKTHDNVTMDDKYSATHYRIQGFTSMGYTVCTIWECSFRKLLKQNPILLNSLQNSNLILYGNINCRDALFGGRTEVFQTLYETAQGERIRYLDFTSLYPYVNKYCKYPVGHPKVYTGQNCNNVILDEIVGLVKCKILPPTNLLIPLLPGKFFDRLVFTLCKTCAEVQNISFTCQHTEEERALVVLGFLAN